MSLRPGTVVITVPGLRGQVDDHWQTRLAARLPNVRPVPPLGRDNPSLADRVAALQAAVVAAGAPVIIVAHSAGVLTTVHWAARHDGPVRGAVLATPPDLACPLPAEYPSLALLRQHGWLPVPRERLPFPSIVAVSSDDALGDPIRVRVLAGAWGSDLRDIGPVGHLNPASGYGEWTPAEALIKELDTSTMEIVNLAELLEREGRLADAQAQWREAAAAGDPRARSRLATLLRRGAPAEDPHATQ